MDDGLWGEVVAEQGIGGKEGEDTRENEECTEGVDKSTDVPEGELALGDGVVDRVVCVQLVIEGLQVFVAPWRVEFEEVLLGEGTRREAEGGDVRVACCAHERVAVGRVAREGTVLDGGQRVRGAGGGCLGFAH